MPASRQARRGAAPGEPARPGGRPSPRAGGPKKGGRKSPLSQRRGPNGEPFVPGDLLLPTGPQGPDEIQYLLRGSVAAEHAAGVGRRLRDHPQEGRAKRRATARELTRYAEGMAERFEKGSIEPLLPSRPPARRNFAGVVERAKHRRREIGAFLRGLDLGRTETSHMDSHGEASLQSLMEWAARLENLAEADEPERADFAQLHRGLDQLENKTEELIVDVELTLRRLRDRAQVDALTGEAPRPIAAAWPLGGARRRRPCGRPPRARPAPAGRRPPAGRARRGTGASPRPGASRAATTSRARRPPGFDDSAWATVTVPHTWGRDRDWRRAWYRTHFDLPAPRPGAPRYLVFEGVSTIADVFVNGRHLGQHRGAFTRFVFDATAHVARGRQRARGAREQRPAGHRRHPALRRAASSSTTSTAASTARPGWSQTAAVHVDPTDHASSGVYVTPSDGHARRARASPIRTLVRNAGAAPRPVQVRQRVRDAKGAEAATLEGEVDGRGGRARRGDASTGAIDAAAALGHRRIRICTRWPRSCASAGRVTDAVDVRTGFRDFRLDGGRFLLNGAPIALRGVGKHQETEYSLAAAMTDEELREDFASLRDLGVNSVRLAHYPHAALEYDLADEMGLLVWAENGHSNESKTTDTGDTITREMVRQNYNHPSIVIWSVGNETGFVRVNRFAAVVQRRGPHRLVTYASNTGGKGKKRYPDLDFIAQNTYRGWYRGEPWEFEQKALSMRFISENGAGAVITNHTDYADARHEVDHFEPEEYRQLMAEVHDSGGLPRPRRRASRCTWSGSCATSPSTSTRACATPRACSPTPASRRTPGTSTAPSCARGRRVVHLTSKTYFLRRGPRRQRHQGLLERGRARRSPSTASSQGRQANGEYRHANGRRDRQRLLLARRPAPRAQRGAGARRRRARGQGHRLLRRRRARPPPRIALVRELRLEQPGRPRLCSSTSPCRRSGRSTPSSTAPPTTPSTSCPTRCAGAGWISTRRLSKPEARTRALVHRRRARPTSS